MDWTQADGYHTRRVRVYALVLPDAGLLRREGVQQSHGRHGTASLRANGLSARVRGDIPRDERVQGRLVRHGDRDPETETRILDNDGHSRGPRCGRFLGAF